MIVLDVLAWTGSASILYAYAVKKSKYQDALHLTGSIFLGAQCVHHGLYANLVTNVLWSIVAIRSMMTADKAGEDNDDAKDEDGPQIPA